MRTYIRASRGRSILGINIFENTPTIFVDLFDGITVRQAVVKHVANQVIDGGFGFLLIEMIQPPIRWMKWKASLVSNEAVYR